MEAAASVGLGSDPTAALQNGRSLSRAAQGRSRSKRPIRLAPAANDRSPPKMTLVATAGAGGMVHCQFATSSISRRSGLISETIMGPEFSKLEQWLPTCSPNWRSQQLRRTKAPRERFWASLRRGGEQPNLHNPRKQRKNPTVTRRRETFLKGKWRRERDCRRTLSASQGIDFHNIDPSRRLQHVAIASGSTASSQSIGRKQRSEHVSPEPHRLAPEADFPLL